MAAGADYEWEPPEALLEIHREWAQKFPNQEPDTMQEMREYLVHGLMHYAVRTGVTAWDAMLSIWGNVPFSYAEFVEAVAPVLGDELCKMIEGCGDDDG